MGGEGYPNDSEKFDQIGQWSMKLCGRRKGPFRDISTQLIRKQDNWGTFSHNVSRNRCAMVINTDSKISFLGK